MKLLHNITTPTYQEIEVERSFLWIKWRVKYRRFVNGSIKRYKEPDTYYYLSLSEIIKIQDLFNIHPTSAE